MRKIITTILVGCTLFVLPSVVAITPRAIIEAAPSKVDAQYTKLKKQISTYVASKHGTYGVYVLDLNTGTKLAIHSTDSYRAASTFKVPLNLYVYSQIAAGKLKPTTKLTYQKGDYESGTGLLQGYRYGSTFTIRKLQEYSITVSDNVATNMLLRLVGKSNVVAYMRRLGAVVVPVPGGKTVSCPADMAIYLQEVLRLQQRSPQLGAEFLHNLSNTVFADRLPAKLPKTVVVAHKIGNWPNTVNDVGIVFLKNRPYIIAVMSKDVSDGIATKAIAEISRMVYDVEKTL